MIFICRPFLPCALVLSDLVVAVTCADVGLERNRCVPVAPGTFVTLLELLSVGNAARKKVPSFFFISKGAGRGLRWELDRVQQGTYVAVIYIDGFMFSTAVFVQQRFESADGEMTGRYLALSLFLSLYCSCGVKRKRCLCRVYLIVPYSKRHATLRAITIAWTKLLCDPCWCAHFLYRKDLTRAQNRRDENTHTTTLLLTHVGRFSHSTRYA